MRGLKLVGCGMLLMALPLGAWWLAEPAHADDDGDGYRVVAPEDIYLGDAREFNRPSVLELAVVFDHIEPYQEIVDKGLTEADAEYWLLLERANRIFDQVLDVLSRRAGFDLIGELGSVVPVDGAPRVPDMTRRAAKLAAGMGGGGPTAIARRSGALTQAGG